MKAKLWHRSGDTRIINKREGIELSAGLEVDINYLPGTSEYSPQIAITMPDESTFDRDKYNYIQIGTAALSTANWADKRKYFYIKDIKSQGKCRYIFDLVLDSLTTYQYELSQCEFIVDRNSNHFNLYVADNSHYAKTYPIMRSCKFPSGFNNTYSYVLSTVGKEVA